MALDENLETEVLKRFSNDEYEITLSWLLERYEGLVAEGFDSDILDVKTKATFYVYPKREV